MSAEHVTESEREQFYRAAIVGLRGLDARLGRARRFGPNAQATWESFRGGAKGELKDPDRVDLLLRDASVTNPDAFAPRVLFEIPGLTEDEPFGPEWPGCPAALARTLLKEADGATSAAATAALALLDQAAAAWGAPAPSVTALVKRLADVDSRTQIVVAGTHAVRAVAARFAGHADLDLAGQVTLVAERPAVRQVLGIAIALVGSAGKASRARVLTPDAEAPKRVDLVLVGDDATPAEREAVARITKNR